jgi:hypothetical protein
MAVDFSLAIGMTEQAELSREPHPVGPVPMKSPVPASVSGLPKPARGWAGIALGLFSLAILSLLTTWALRDLLPRQATGTFEATQTGQLQPQITEVTPATVIPVTSLHTAVSTSTPALVNTGTPTPITAIQKIDFDYEDSPTKHGWEMLSSEAQEAEIQIEHTSDQFVGNAISISSPVRYAMDFKVGLEAAQRGKVVELVAILTEDTSIFLYTGLVQDNGTTSKGWLKLKSRKGPPQPVDEDEWQLSIEPVSSKGGNWSLYRVDLQDAVMQTFGNDGWKFQQLEKFRIRGSLSLDYIYIYEAQP